MKKLSLDLNSLRVETFAPVAAPTARRGTVRGNEIDPAAYPEMAAYGESYDIACSYGCTGDDKCILATLPPACI